MIEDFFTTTFLVTRMVWSNESSSEISQGSFLGQLQQAEIELAEQFRLDFTRSFKVWCALDTDVEDGDTLTVGNDTYSVKANKVHMTGNHQHKLLIIEKDVMEISA